MAFFISESASVTKSLRGAKAHIAKARIKVEDDDHESDIKKGEKFYLKKLGQRHYLIDVEKEGAKEVLYQFIIDAKKFADLGKRHPAADGDSGAGKGKSTPAGKASGNGPKANSKDLQSADTINAFKSAFKAAGLNVKVTKNKISGGISVGFTGKPSAEAVEKAFGELAKNTTGTIYAKEINRVSGGRGKASTAKKEFVISNKRTPGKPQGLAYKITKSGATSEGNKASTKTAAKPAAATRTKAAKTSAKKETAPLKEFDPKEIKEIDKMVRAHQKLLESDIGLRPGSKKYEAIQKQIDESNDAIAAKLGLKHKSGDPLIVDLKSGTAATGAPAYKSYQGPIVKSKQRWMRYK